MNTRALRSRIKKAEQAANKRHGDFYENCSDLDLLVLIYAVGPDRQYRADLVAKYTGRTLQQAQGFINASKAAASSKPTDYDSMSDEQLVALIQKKYASTLAHGDDFAEAFDVEEDFGCDAYQHCRNQLIAYGLTKYEHLCTTEH